MDELMTTNTMEQLNETEMNVLTFDEMNEKAPSMEIQSHEIRDAFFDIPELQYENWENLNVDQRVEALQQLENRVADIACRPIIEVTAGELDYGVLGQYRYETGQMIISGELLADNSQYKEVLNTLFHEGRHAYQYENLYSGKVTEQNQELVDAWRVNLDVLGYENGNSSIFREIGFYRYYTQPIEVDARAFAAEVMRTINL